MKFMIKNRKIKIAAIRINWKPDRVHIEMHWIVALDGGKRKYECLKKWKMSPH